MADARKFDQLYVANLRGRCLAEYGIIAEQGTKCGRGRHRIAVPRFRHNKSFARSLNAGLRHFQLMRVPLIDPGNGR